MGAHPSRLLRSKMSIRKARCSAGETVWRSTCGAKVILSRLNAITSLRIILEPEIAHATTPNLTLSFEALCEFRPL